MKKLVFALFAMVFIIGSLFCGQAEAKSLKLRVGHDLPPFTTPGMGIDAWAKEVNAKTEGRVVVEVYPTSTMAEEKSGVEMLQAAVADAYMISLGIHRRLFPVCAITGLQGLGFTDTVEVHLAHANTFSAFIDKYPAIANELKDIKLIFDIINSNSILLSTKPGIRLPTDLKGLKLGAFRTGIEFAKKMGGAGVFCVPPQAY